MATAIAATIGGNCVENRIAASHTTCVIAARTASTTAAYCDGNICARRDRVRRIIDKTTTAAAAAATSAAPTATDN